MSSKNDFVEEGNIAAYWSPGWLGEKAAQDPGLAGSPDVMDQGVHWFLVSSKYCAFKWSAGGSGGLGHKAVSGGGVEAGRWSWREEQGAKTEWSVSSQS